MLWENLCFYCGACCAHCRVSFYWVEADMAQGGAVPSELTPFWLCMKGTNHKQPHCIALRGEVGGAVHCAIHVHRPTPCREFGLTWKNGVLHAEEGKLERCNEARAAWGLPSLCTPAYAPAPGDLLPSGWPH